MSADAWDSSGMPRVRSPRQLVIQREGRDADCSVCHAPAAAGVGVYLAGQVGQEHKHFYICSGCVIRMHREVMGTP